MILIGLNLAELAAGQKAINDFNNELEHAWMPGFSRSYARRQEIYLKATQRYEERNLLLRLLFRKPKQPQRPPAGYSTQVTLRLQQDWLDSLQPAAHEIQAASKNVKSFLDFLAGTLDDRFFALTNLQVDPQLIAEQLVTGPSGIWLFEINDKHGRRPASEHDDNHHLSALANWTNTSEAIGASLQSRSQLDPEVIATLLPLKGAVISNSDQEQPQPHAAPPTAVRTGRVDDCRRWLEEPSTGDDIEQATIFQILDSLLSRHQELQHIETSSALTTAQKLMKREKDELLRMAATL